ncbi:MAG: carbohydrate-binding family 9-like protein [Verrucomicrobiota bacterium]
MVKPITAFCMMAATLSASAIGQESGSPAPIDITVPYALCAGATAVPVIDGRLDDACWKRSVELGPFVRMAGGELPREDSRAYLVYDDKYLYLGIECDESLLDERLQRTHEIKREMKDRDAAVYADDCVEIFLQPDPAQGAYYHLVINSLGTLYDARCGKDGATDKGWNSNAKIAVSSDQKAWRVELAMPWSDFDLAAREGRRFRFNICRHACPSQEYTCWSPTGTGFHQPDKFGVVVLGGPVLGMRRISPPEFSEGAKVYSVTLVNPAKDGRKAQVAALVKYDAGDWISHAQTVPVPPEGEAAAKTSYRLSAGENLCFALEASADKANDTLCFKSDYLPIKADTEYTVSAMVRAENLTGGGRPLVLSVSSYDAARKPIKGYEQALVVPTGTYAWQRIEGKWRSATNAAEILFWAVKWGGSGVTGAVWIDDMRLCPAGSCVSILPNGAIDRDADGVLAGWPDQAGWLVAPSYARGTQANVVFQVSDATGPLIYSSAVIAGEIAKRDTAISSSLMLLACMADSADILRLKPLYAAQGGYLYLPVVFRSSMLEELDGCQLTLEVPAFLHLVDPNPRATILKREQTTREGQSYIRYALSFPAESISSIVAQKETTVLNHLLFKCEIVSETKNEWRLFYAAAAGGKQEMENEVPLLLLPPLEWKRPAGVIIDNWACSSFYRPLSTMNEKEVDLVAGTFRMAGFNQIGKAIGSNYIRKYDFRLQGSIPLINHPGSLFPGGMEYLAAHKEAWAVDFSGKQYNNCFCPTYFLSAENKHLPAVEQWLEQEAKGLAMLDWDYEVPVTRPASICVCARCLKAFREAAKITPDIELTAQSILAKYRKEWVDFRCRQNAEISGLFQAPIKRGNPQCVYSVYSGYQGPTDEQYGVDWRYMSKHCDFVWCGYGRSTQMIAATHAAIGDRPFIGGELAWYGSAPYNNTNIKPVLFRRLTDCGSGIMTYFNWIVDGRFYGAVSAVAGLVADFEPFFSWDVDAKGVFHSHYKRDDALVEVAGEGTKDDVTVLTQGNERLVFIFNEGKNSRKFQIKNLAWKEGLASVDYGTKKVGGAEVAIDVPAHDVRILHVVDTADGAAVEAPDPMSAAEMEKLACYPLLAWRGQGGRPGDQVFTLEISPDEKFPDGQTWRREGLASTIHVIDEASLKAGESYFWRVRGKDAVSGKEGPYSAAVSFRVPLFKDVYVWPPVLNPQGMEPGNGIHVAVTLAGEMKWNVTFTDSTNKVVKTFAGGGSDIRVTWDGKDGEGLLCPDGVYQYALAVEKFTAGVVTGQVVLNQKFGLRNPSLAVCRKFCFTRPDGTVKLEHDYAITRTRTYSIRMTAEAPKGTAYWSNYSGGGVEGIIPVTPGKKYAFRAWLRTELSAGEGTITLAFFTRDGRWATVPGHNPWGTDSAKVTCKSDWTEQNVTLTAPEDANSAVLFFRVKDAVGACWFDDVSFAEVE